VDERHSRQLAEEIAALAEKAFRRGFQHGYQAARGEMGAKPPSQEEVFDWRFSQDARVASPAPPGTQFAGRGEGSLERLKMRVGGDDFPALQVLLRSLEGK